MLTEARLSLRIFLFPAIADANSGHSFIRIVHQEQVLRLPDEIELPAGTG
jgi:hypothetical protein